MANLLSHSSQNYFHLEVLVCTELRKWMTLPQYFPSLPAMSLQPDSILIGQSTKYCSIEVISGMKDKPCRFFQILWICDFSQLGCFLFMMLGKSMGKGRLI